MIGWKAAGAALFGLVGLLIALWINHGATLRDEAETARQCGPAPADESKAQGYDYCAATVRNNIGR